jgi:hypothetical protein
MKHPRRGAMLLEVMVATALLAVTVSVCLKALTVMGRQQLALDRRACATEVASNLLERLSGLDWSALTPAMATEVRLPATAARRLPAPQLDVQVTPRKSPEAKQITVIIRWQAAASQSARPVRLTTWVYRRGGPQP